MCALAHIQQLMREFGPCLCQYEICVENLKCVQQQLADKQVHRIRADVLERLQKTAEAKQNAKAACRPISFLAAYNAISFAIFVIHCHWR